MADNVTANPGTGGSVFSTEDIGSGVQLPVSKAAFGAHGVSNPVDDLYGKRFPVALAYGATNTMGEVKVTDHINFIEVPFYRDVPANLVSATLVGGGTATQTTGFCQLASSTGTTGEVKLVSLDNVFYRSTSEVYAMFTAAWIDGGVGSCSQRIGLYDTNNGFYIGYEGTTFGVSVRTGAADTQTAKASWNVDTLTGAATSKFTRGGTAEAINLALMNVFRIRFSWFGAAPIRFEVLSPDGDWVLFHIIRQPNLVAGVSLQNVDLPITCHVVKTAGATNQRMNTGCWAAGITSTQEEFISSGTLGTAANSVVNFPTDQINTLYVACNTTTTGTLIFEATLDGTNWITHPQCLKISSSDFDKVVYTAQTPTSGDRYEMAVSGYRGLRCRTASLLGATVTLVYHGEAGVALIKQIDMASPPHNFGYTLVNKNAQYTTAQTGVALWTPASGKRIIVLGCQIQCFGTTAGTVELWFGASGDTAFTRGTDSCIFDGEFAPSATSKPGVVQNGIWDSLVADYVLRVTSSAAVSLNFNVWGYEV